MRCRSIRIAIIGGISAVLFVGAYLPELLGQYANVSGKLSHELAGISGNPRGSVGANDYGNPTNLGQPQLNVAAGPAARFAQQPQATSAENGGANAANNPTSAKGTGDSNADAGKQAQNPIADLVSLPLQNNWNFGVGPNARTQYVGLLQPVIPLKVNERLNLVTRPIIPFINTPIGSDDSEHGLGDLQWQNFFVPVQPSGSEITWGIGPSFVAPIASDPQLGLQRWGAGISGVRVRSTSKTVSGFLFNQNFIEGGVSQPFLFQPFYNYNFDSKGILKNTFISVSGEFQADWQADGDQRWNSLLGIGPGKTVKIMGQPMNISTRFGAYLDTPTGGPDWQFRFAVTYLFPK